MIAHQWYVILDSAQLRRNRLLRVRRLGEEMVLWRDGGAAVHCLIDRCCHRGAALSAGKIVGDALQCPFHGFEYNGEGRCTCIPAAGRKTPVPDRYRVRSLPVHEEHGWIWVWKSKDLLASEENPAPPAYFPDIDGGFRYTTVRDPWNTHYSRVLENQLDVVHLPFVHRTTIGRGGRTLVDGPGTQWINDRMLYTYVFNRIDDGTPAKKPSEVPVPPQDNDFKLELIMPNLWENRISDKVRIVAAFVPVDDERTVLYLRTYQKIARLPLLRSLIGFLFGRMNLVIAHQDRRVVETQRPKASRLRGGEMLIQGDLPIIAYRRRREELLSADRKAADTRL